MTKQPNPVEEKLREAVLTITGMVADATTTEELATANKKLKMLKELSSILDRIDQTETAERLHELGQRIDNNYIGLQACNEKLARSAQFGIDWNKQGTVTGRSSGKSNMNFQQQMAIASTNSKLVDADFGDVEARVVAQIHDEVVAEVDTKKNKYYAVKDTVTVAEIQKMLKTGGDHATP
jgi:hypothetical protein